MVLNTRLIIFNPHNSTQSNLPSVSCDQISLLSSIPNEMKTYKHNLKFLNEIGIPISF